MDDWMLHDTNCEFCGRFYSLKAWLFPADTAWTTWHSCSRCWPYIMAGRYQELCSLVVPEEQATLKEKIRSRPPHEADTWRASLEVATEEHLMRKLRGYHRKRRKPAIGHPWPLTGWMADLADCADCWQLALQLKLEGDDEQAPHLIAGPRTSALTLVPDARTVAVTHFTQAHAKLIPGPWDGCDDCRKGKAGEEHRATHAVFELVDRIEATDRITHVVFEGGAADGETLTLTGLADRELILQPDRTTDHCTYGPTSETRIVDCRPRVVYRLLDTQLASNR